jgi:hypothetical protein
VPAWLYHLAASIPSKSQSFLKTVEQIKIISSHKDTEGLALRVIKWSGRLGRKNVGSETMVKTNLFSFCEYCSENSLMRLTRDNFRDCVAFY